MIRHLAAAASLAFLVTADSPLPTRERQVEIVAFDYAFKLPTELPPGRTIFSFVNKGKVPGRPCSTCSTSSRRVVIRIR